MAVLDAHDSRCCQQAGLSRTSWCCSTIQHVRCSLRCAPTAPRRTPSQLAAAIVVYENQANLKLSEQDVADVFNAFMNSTIISKDRPFYLHSSDGQVSMHVRLGRCTSHVVGKIRCQLSKRSRRVDVPAGSQRLPAVRGRVCAGKSLHAAPPSPLLCSYTRSSTRCTTLA